MISKKALFKTIRITPFIIFLSFFSCLFTVDQTLNSSTDKINNGTYVGTPTNNAKFIGIVCISDGIKNQITLDTYKTINNTIKLSIETERSLKTWLGNPGKTPHYTWYEKGTDGIGNWIPIPKENKDTIYIKPDKAGNYYYQVKVSYYNSYLPSLGSEDMYSKVATLHILPNRIPTDSFDINTTSDYLYNNESGFGNTSTQATASLHPTNSTEKVNWSSDDNSLATIDDNGKIIANKSKLSGNFWINGIVLNNGLKKMPVYGRKMIRIGGGLDDQTVKAGHDASFKILGLDKETNPITWYKNGKKIKSNGKSYLDIHKVNEKNNGEKYYAKMLITYYQNFKKITKSFTTNEATLNVIPSNDPNVIISTTLNNEAIYANKNDLACTLNNVTNKDTVDYHINLTNRSNKPITNSTLSIPIHSYSIIQSIKVDNDYVTSKYLDTHRDSNKNIQKLTLNIKKLKYLESETIQIETQIQDIPPRSRESSTSVHYTDVSNNQNYEKYGPGTTINYITNKLASQFHDINFEPIKPLDNNVIKYRLAENNNLNDIISIDDERRLKVHTQLLLTQTSEFVDKKNNNVLNARLKFYSKNPLQSSDLTPNVPFNLEETKTGYQFKSIHWAKDEGLLLKTGKGPFKPGSYSAKLTWNFVESI